MMLILTCGFVHLYYFVFPSLQYVAVFGSVWQCIVCGLIHLPYSIFPYSVFQLLHSGLIE